MCWKCTVVATLHTLLEYQDLGINWNGCLAYSGLKKDTKEFIREFRILWEKIWNMADRHRWKKKCL